MKILHLVKYYDPCKGGMESLVKLIVEGCLKVSKNLFFTIYSNSHTPTFSQIRRISNDVTIVNERTPLIFKSQPLNITYSGLKHLIMNNDVIHHHYPFPSMEFSLYRNVKHLKNKKFILTWHANVKNTRWRWVEGFYNLLIIKLLDRADKIIVTSPQLYDSSSILTKYSEKVTIIPLSFDPHYLSDKPRKFPCDRSFELLFVGKLREYKGVEYLLKAILTLDVTLKIVGNGEELNNLQNLVRDLNITNKVTFICDADDDLLSSIYKNSDLLILPSISEAEAFGLVQLEAMANGLPVINTNLESGVPFVSLNEFSGITVTPKNVNELKYAIEKIITNKNLYELFSSNALQRVKVFSREKMIESYMNLYGGV
jgi:glycosyltransferase involved in cell wall biosynthesis